MSQEQFLRALRGLTQSVEDALARALSDQLSSLRALAPEVEPFAAAAAEFTRRGGKRLRGALVLAGHQAWRPLDDEAITAAAALELFHAYLLAHDDAMDRDEQRRGGPTLHVWFSAQRHDPQLGDALAYLAGDLLSAWSQSLFASLTGPGAARAQRVFAQAHIQVVAGQYLDLEPGHTVTEDALRVGHDCKTGGYSVLAPLQIGAALAGASEEALRAFTPYALHLGRAFQAKDDLLGLYGDAKQTGKPVGADLARARRTWLLMDLLQQHPQAARELLANRPSPGAPIEGFTARAQARLEELGTRARCEAYVSAQVKMAREALAALSLPSEQQTFLDDLADYVASREF